ncbi:MAG TPA: hypothetical protein DCS07_05540, partial [Bdellovibrionales bacterium]|nr:hypothetical protein [Bdellovibrionales bacterium]
VRKYRKRTLLITPLIALARQQVADLQNRGFRVRVSTGGRTELPLDDTEIWIVSPEALMSDSRRVALDYWRPELMVVDECHCLWDWGEEFRPAFNRIPSLLERFNITRSLWLTATLPVSARASLKKLLPSSVIEIGQFDLPENFRLTVQELSSADRLDALLRWTSSQDEHGIIFAQTRANAERIGRLMTVFGKRTVTYHAGLSSEERHIIENQIKTASTEIIVATSAFGMGMNHKHLRWVVVWQPPSTLLSLTQAIGRAGRDPAKPGKALVLWNLDDFRLMLNRKPESIRASQRYFQELGHTQRFLESRECRSVALKRYFQAQPGTVRCRSCDNCQI